MISTKCDKCKNKAWCWSCDDCQSKPLSCFVCDEIITYRERHNHMSKHYNDPDQYLVSKKSNVNKHISHYRFKHYTCRICLYLNRYRFGHTKERFKEHAKKYNILEAVQRSCFANSPIVKHGEALSAKQFPLIEV